LKSKFPPWYIAENQSKFPPWYIAENQTAKKKFFQSL